MPDRFLPDYGLYLLGKGVRPETRLVFFDLPVEHLTRPRHRFTDDAEKRRNP